MAPHEDPLAFQHMTIKRWPHGLNISSNQTSILKGNHYCVIGTQHQLLKAPAFLPKAQSLFISTFPQTINPVCNWSSELGCPFNSRGKQTKGPFLPKGTKLQPTDLLVHRHISQTLNPVCNCSELGCPFDFKGKQIKRPLCLDKPAHSQVDEI